MNQPESMTEVYLKKIVEQNATIIDLLKGIVSKSPDKDDDIKIIADQMESLTKRERQILELVMQGMMNKQMAYDLSLSLSTIEAHRSGVMKKLEVKNITELTKKYMIFKSLSKY